MKCYESIGHAHKLEEVLSVGPVPNQKQTHKIDEFIDSLKHAFTCFIRGCAVRGCMRIKNLFDHVKSCSQKVDGSCYHCKKFIAFLCSHAKHCMVEKCTVPYCIVIKLMRSHQLLPFHEQKLSKRRRITATISS